MDMGTGKSKIAVDEALQLYIDGTIDRFFIVAGKGSYADWLDKHLPENVPDYMRVVAHLWRGGRSVTEQAQLRGLMYEDPTYGRAPPLRALIMNVESLGVSDIANTVAKNFVGGGRTLVVCDESTKIRNTGAARTLNMIEIGKLAIVKRAMTGMATPKNPLDLWGQMEFLGLSGLLGVNWFAYRARYCQMEVKKFHKSGQGQGLPKGKAARIVGYRNLDKLADVMRPYVYRALKKDCLDLPPKIYQQVSVELTDRQRAAYRDMLKLSTTELEDGVYASALNAIGRITRLHQILCGWIVDESGVVHEVETNRLDVMCDVIDEMTGKIIIWCAYQHDVIAVRNRLQKQYAGERGAVVTYYGPTSTAERREAVEAFQNGEADFFVGTASTGGFGITLTSSNNTIYYSNSFDLEHRLQSEDRNHRDGTTSAVTYVDLVSRGTVDVKIIRALMSKKSVADVIMDGGVQPWLTLDD